MSQHYDLLVYRLNNLLAEAGEDVLLPPRWSNPKADEQRAFIEVHKRFTDLTPDHWAKLSEDEREHWLEETIKRLGTPDDYGDYVPFSKLWPGKFNSLPAASRFLKKDGKNIRRHKPSPQRLNVHAGDWFRYWINEEEGREVTEEELDKFMEGIEQRKEDAHRRKSQGR